MWSFFIFTAMKRTIISIIFISIFSITIWTFISLSGEYFATIKFPIKVTNIPSNYAISNCSTKEVTLSLKAQGWQLAQLSFGINPDFMVPNTRKFGRHNVMLRNVLDVNDWLSSSIQVIEILPNRIEFDIENRVAKKVRVVPSMNLSFKPGYGLVSEAIISTDSVEVSGPVSVIDKIENVKTKFKKFENLDRKFSTNLEIEEVDNVEFSTTETVIQFDIQKIVDKTFAEISVETKNVPRTRELQLFPDKISVVLRGGINILGKLQQDKIKAYVFYRDALLDTAGSIVPRVEVPNKTLLIDTKPQRLEYIIKQF
ncbi:MAG: hypothetical protein A2V66_08385 [Ignavibacteria bacterium RBG_13_36_8]|nr:MAG: hypothetical protein A2V66_08385 [Ignavibacteria bacterium RBG_13_36_8]